MKMPQECATLLAAANIARRPFILPMFANIGQISSSRTRIQQGEERQDLIVV